MNAKDIGDITGLRERRETAARTRRRGVRVSVEMLESRELLSTLNTVAAVASPATGRGRWRSTRTATSGWRK